MKEDIATSMYFTADWLCTTNNIMKSHTCFRFVPIPMTLNDLERCNSPYFAFISVKYCLWVPVFHFRPKLIYPAARSLCDSWASCQSWFEDGQSVTLANVVR